VNNAGRSSITAAEYPMEVWDELIAVDRPRFFRLSQLAGGTCFREEPAADREHALPYSLSRAEFFVPPTQRQRVEICAVDEALANEWASKHQRECNCSGIYGDGQHYALRADPVEPSTFWSGFRLRDGANPRISWARRIPISSASDYVHGHVLAVTVAGWALRAKCL